MQHPRTDVGSSGPHYGKKEQTVFVPIPLIIGTALSQNSRILTSKGNPASYVQADGRNNMSSVLANWKP